MKSAKQKKLEKAGWTVGSAAEFLELQPAEEIIVAMKLALASKLKILRMERRLTQEQLAKQIGSSQSRGKAAVSNRVSWFTKKQETLKVRFQKSLIRFWQAHSKIGRG